MPISLSAKFKKAVLALASQLLASGSRFTFLHRPSLSGKLWWILAACESGDGIDNMGHQTEHRPTNRTVEEWRSMPTWLRYGVIGLLVLGIFLRFYHLDRKVYWIDETSTSLRTLGYTRQEVLQNAFTGQVISVEDFRQYQRLSPEKGWGDTLNALAGSAEHTPLYFLLSRFWVGLVGHSVATMRFLTALFSVLAIPCLYWLCRLLFAAPAVAWVTIAWYAITPIHVLYAQEARPYSLLTLLTLLSSALLLKAVQVGKRWHWVAYSAAIAMGLYTQLLFSLVAIAQGIYILAIEQVWRKRFTQTIVAYLIAGGAAALSFLPWIILLITRQEQVSESTVSLSGSFPLSYMVDRWTFHLNQALLDRDLASANLLIVLLSGFALYFLCRRTTPKTWLFVLLLATIPFLGLAIPDLLNGGRRSLRIRYLFPFILGVQLALAYLMTTLALEMRGWKQKVGQLLLVLFIVAGVIACSISSQAVVWWNKSNPRSAYYPIVSEIINQEKNPLVISDGSVSDTLAFSAWLRPDIKLQLVEDFHSLKIAEGYAPIFLLNPEPDNRKIVRQDYQLKLIYEDRTDPEDIEQRLWAVSKRQRN
ncbi:MAG TPA: glycosyltransferase family 39 protein [Trichocoleus sp.]|jgi:uncharacterized membrane protein